MYVVCADHLEEAIDEFLEEFGVPPDLYELEDLSCTDWTAPEQCQFCERVPEYLVV